MPRCNLSAQLFVTVTREEHDRLKRIARTEGFKSVSAFVRAAIDEKLDDLDYATMDPIRARRERGELMTRLSVFQVAP